MAVLVSDKMHFKIKILLEKERWHLEMTIKSIHPVGITIIIIYVPNNIVWKFMKKKFRIKDGNRPSTRIAEDVNTLFQ